MSEDSKRTAMLWPPDLKERVRQRVGARGLTAFTLEAVEAKLTGHDASQEELTQLRHDLKFAREYAQRAVDSLACVGELEGRQERLMEIGVPAWVDTTGWPEWAVALKVDSGVDTPMDKEDPGLEEGAGQEPVSEPATGDTPTVNTHFEHPAHDASVETWREYARERGILPDEPDGIDSMNRSQIRTMLGIPHPVGEEKPAPSKMRTCEGCGEEFDVFTDGEFEKHLAHKARPEPEAVIQTEATHKTIDEKGEPVSVRVLEVQAQRAAEVDEPVQPVDESVQPDLPHDAQGPKNDLFERLQSDAKGLGIDLKPASEVLRPVDKPREYEDDIPEEPTEPAPDLEVEADMPTPEEVRPAIAVCPNHPANEIPCPECCPTCGSELVGGECWECM